MLITPGNERGMFALVGAICQQAALDLVLRLRTAPDDPDPRAFLEAVGVLHKAPLMAESYQATKRLGARHRRRR